MKDDERKGGLLMIGMMECEAISGGIMISGIHVHAINDIRWSRLVRKWCACRVCGVERENVVMGMRCGVQREKASTSGNGYGEHETCWMSIIKWVCW